MRADRAHACKLGLEGIVSKRGHSRKLDFAQEQPNEVSALPLLYEPKQPLERPQFSAAGS
jgi:hypothetical protein